MRVCCPHETLMRIGLNFHSADGYPSGVEYYALGLLRGLLGIDAKNEYVVYANQPDLVKQSVPPAPNLTVISATHCKTRMARILWEHTELPHLAVRHGLDVLHCTSYVCPAVRTSVPYVVTIHDTLALDRPGWCKPTNVLYFQLALRRSARVASRVISVSQQTARDLCRRTNVVPSNIRVVYAGVDDVFCADGDPLRRRRVRRRYSLPDRYILYVGNIEPKKNVSTMLRVQSQLHERGLPHKLVIAGKRSWRARSELQGVERGVASGGVVWIGYADRGDLPYIYQMADAFLFPSLYEGFGFPPLEAMACGTPVVSSSRGALAETAAGAAILADPDDPEQIAAAVIAAITDPQFRGKHVEMGFQRSGTFTWASSAKATLSVYEEVGGGDG